MTASQPVSGFSRGPALSPWTATHLLILGFAALHLLVAAALPLIAFETHYALYGVHLDWSYIDHPPMVGWIQALVQCFSGTDLAMRVAPVLLTTASQYLLALLALRLFPQDTRWLGFFTVLLLQGALIIHLSIAMAPEVPLLLAGLLVVWFVNAVLEEARPANWLGLGVALGLAGLSKYTAITLAVSTLLAILLAGRWRLLLQPWAWLAVLVAGVMVSPVLLWNWQHDWASFNYQIGYQMDSDESSWSLADALGMQLEQLAAYSPALYLGGLAAVGSALFAGSGRSGPGTRLLLAFALPILLLFAYLAGVGRSSAHWTLLGWVFVAPLAVRWLIGHWPVRAVRYLVYGSAGLSLLVLLAAFVLLLPAAPFPDYGHPLSRVLGWREAAARAESLGREWQAESGGEAPVLLVYNWHYAGPLAWYGEGTPVLDTDGDQSQYQYWYGSVGEDTRGILVVFDEKNEVPEVNEPGFECSQVDTLPAYRGNTLARLFYFYRCERADVQP